MKQSIGGLMRRTILAVIAAFLMFAPSNAGAEGFIDVYGGFALAENTDADVSASGGGSTLVGKFKDVELDQSFLVGLRAGRWLEKVEYLGFAIDVFGFRPDIESQTTKFSGTGSVNVGNDVVVAAGSTQARINGLELKVLGVSADVMLRLLPADRTPTTMGEIHAYLLAGPTLFVASLESETDTVFGFNVGAGLTWLPSPHTGFFIEYRYTRFSPNFDLKSGGVKLKIDSDISTHHLMAGLSYRF